MLIHVVVEWEGWCSRWCLFPYHLEGCWNHSVVVEEERYLLVVVVVYKLLWPSRLLTRSWAPSWSPGVWVCPYGISVVVDGDCCYGCCCFWCFSCCCS